MDLPGPLVDADWLAAAAGDDDLVVADVRWVLGGSGRAAYEAGHIPGAVFVDVDADLAAAPGSGGRHPLPTPEDFARRMGAIGIGDVHSVVAYDDVGGSTAARLWWMLAVLGHPAAVLDGGLPVWAGPLEGGEVIRPSAVFTPRPWPSEAVVDAERVEELIRDGTPVLDARAPERYRGEVEPIDARAGHIPGARSAPWEANLDAATGRFLAPEELRRRYEGLGVVGGGAAVVYCGSGVTSCHDLLAIELAGLGRPRLYVGSWSAWSADPARPSATGAG